MNGYKERALWEMDLKAQTVIQAILQLYDNTTQHPAVLTQTGTMNYTQTDLLLFNT